MKIKSLLYITAFLVALALWGGYGLGYHHGVNDERQAWTATAQMDNNNGHPRILYHDPRAGPFTVAWERWRTINDVAGRITPLK
jgi:hypothetical protein